MYMYIHIYMFIYLYVHACIQSPKIPDFKHPSCNDMDSCKLVKGHSANVHRSLSAAKDDESIDHI